MRTARIFCHTPEGFSFDLAIGEQPLSLLTHTWRADGFILADAVAGPFMPWGNVALVMTYDTNGPAGVKQGPGTVVNFPFGIAPQPPKEPA